MGTGKKDMTMVAEAPVMAKVFMSGRSQAVRIPKAFRFDTDEVEIKRTKEGVLLVPRAKEEEWQWLKKIRGAFDDEFFEVMEQVAMDRNKYAELDDQFDGLEFDVAEDE